MTGIVRVVVMLLWAEAPVAPATQSPAVRASCGFPLTTRRSVAPVTVEVTSMEAGEPVTVAVLFDAPEVDVEDEVFAL